MLPCHDPDVLSAGRNGQLVGQRGDDTRRKDAGRRRDGADEILQSPRQLCRGLYADSTARHALDCEPVPVGKGGLIAGVEVADIAQQPGERDQVIGPRPASGRGGSAVRRVRRPGT